MKISRSEIIRLLNTFHIDYDITKHEAIYTVSEGMELNLQHADVIAKSLFICDNKKQNYYLISLSKEKRIDLKALRIKLKSFRLCFASEEDLNEILNLSKGAVTPLGILNDSECKVNVLIDDIFYDSLIGVPLNENTETIWMKAKDLFFIIKQHGNEVEWIEIT